MQQYKYFLGKVCTIITVATARGFTEQQFADYFLGIIEEINEFGIVVIHPITKCKGFYNHSHVIGIIEEQVFHPENEEEAAALRKKIESLPRNELQNNDSKFLDIDSLTKLT